MEDRENILPIKCLSITGGGHNGFSSIAILKETHNKLWNYNSLESIYSTSSGSIIAVAVALKLNIDHLITYSLERPFDNIITFDSSRLLSLVNENGMYGPDAFIAFFKPLFASAEIDININLKDFYEFTRIKLNIFVSEVNAFESIIVTHETFPELSVIDAIAMSAAIPIIFKPIQIGDKYYFDGGFFKASPYHDALSAYSQCEILAICERYHIDKNYDNRPVRNTNISNFFMILLSNTMRSFNLNNNDSFIETPTTFIMESEALTPSTLYRCKEHSYRKELYEYGITISKKKLLAQCRENEPLQ